ncbi:uncharacterized protein CLUP02_08156 [Colletotrichum lupini]|uniref:Uncharacterized protein n=1 Tax=Colletotrichum lupini TaxID=145971 RepID=A0A9Q8SSG1_9PEZI|nr:uncharacterized protein CLUP02_08156 [Colletotrichum lupini]UQC82666.1 hypothetical protein CLUP02_08156 [Colletotrichum lupini]
MVLSSGGWWLWKWCPATGRANAIPPFVPNQQMVVLFSPTLFLKFPPDAGPWTVRVSRFSLFVFEILCLPCIRQFSWPMDQDDGMAA